MDVISFLWVLLVSSDRLWCSHESLIHGKFDLKMNQSVKVVRQIKWVLTIEAVLKLTWTDKKFRDRSNLKNFACWSPPQDFCVLRIGVSCKTSDKYDKMKTRAFRNNCFCKFNMQIYDVSLPAPFWLRKLPMEMICLFAGWLPRDRFCHRKDSWDTFLRRFAGLNGYLSRYFRNPEWVSFTWRENIVRLVLYPC